MKKRKYLYLVTAILMSMILIVGLTGCGSSSDQPKTITFKLSYAPPAGSIYGQAYTEFAKYLEEETKGQVKVQLFPAGSLLGDQQALDAVMQGTVDMVHVMVPYASATIKELTPFEIPGAYSGNRWAELEAKTHPVLDKIFAKYKIHYVGSTDTNVMTFVANQKVGKPIQSLADLKGTTVRTAGVWGGKAIESWGGAPVTISLGDLPNALQLGTIDVAFTGWVITGPNKLYEMAPYVTLTGFQESFAMLLMAEGSYNKMNDEQKAAFKRAADKWMKFNHELSAKLKEQFIKDVNAYPGTTLVTLTDEQNKAFVDVSTDRLLEETKAISGPEGAELIEIFKTLR